MRIMIRRRAVLAGLGIGVVSPRTGAATLPMMVAEKQITQTPNFGILACGPRDGTIDRWARAVAQSLTLRLSPTGPVRLSRVGGLDGVTGANHLQTFVVPDGKTAAMIPSDAIIAFLTGDPRVHFQPGDWIPVLAGKCASVLVVRGGLGRLENPMPIKLAAASPESLDLAALLAFKRLGVEVSPIFGLRGTNAVSRAFASGEADAALLTGENVPADIATLSANGGVAVGTLGVVDDREQVAIDPLLHGLPTIHAVAKIRGIPPLSHLLEQAFRSVSAATRIDFIMVLPHLTAPAKVAAWRQAAMSAIQSPALNAAAAASSVDLTVAAAAASAAPFDVQANELLALRQFLFQYFGWHPS